LSRRAYRLPSEAEWEYACRAQTSTPFHYGPTLTPQLANYCGTGGAVCGMNNGKDISSLSYSGTSYTNGAYDLGPLGTFAGKTMPVRSFPPNRFGLHEMHGNVWEHCLDTWQPNYIDAMAEGGPNESGPQDLHVLRGGSWSHNPAICRSAYREPIRADLVGWQGRIGLRVVCEL
jgi:formylglycine-generating enzyme required for sulfatase activity